MTTILHNPIIQIEWCLFIPSDKNTKCTPTHAGFFSIRLRMGILVEISTFKELIEFSIFQLLRIQQIKEVQLPNLPLFKRGGNQYFQGEKYA